MDHEHDDQQPEDRFPRETEEEWAALLSQYVGAMRPRVFALFEERGVREDAIPVAWGLAHPSHVDLAFADGLTRGRFQNVESVQSAFCRTGRLRFAWEPHDPGPPPSRHVLLAWTGTR